MKARGLQKSQFSKSLVNWQKFGSAAKAFQKYSIRTIHSPRPSFQNPHFESMDELGKFIS